MVWVSGLCQPSRDCHLVRMCLEIVAVGRAEDALPMSGRDACLLSDRVRCPHGSRGGSGSARAGSFDVEVLQHPDRWDALCPTGAPGTFPAELLSIGGTSGCRARGEADLHAHLSFEIPRLFLESRIHPDARTIQVSPPDAHWICSHGSRWMSPTAAVELPTELTPRIRNMPRTRTDCSCASAIGRLVRVIVRSWNCLPSLPSAEADRIAELIAALVPDGATLQMGLEYSSAVSGALATSGTRHAAPRC